mmetsp:Transcript_11741/g.27272  ORF Transcript_11741/g.27272 Transcript_11741/m.27272 type:complete len:217 (+) Transcript_11741:20-670(+)
MRGRHQVLAAVALLAAACLLASACVQQGSKREVWGEGGQRVALEQEVGEIKESVLGSLEESLDKSIDSKVKSYLSIPQMSSMPVSCNDRVGCAGEDWGEGHMIEEGERTYLGRLMERQEELEERKERVLAHLRHQRDEASEKVAKGMVGMERRDLHGFLRGAELRVGEEAAKWQRLAQAKQNEAYIAELYAAHTRAATQKRNAEMDGMVRHAASLQ